jgi:hypothetical protein
MPDHQPDSRSLNFAGDVDEQGCPLPMTVEVLRARTEKWPRSPQTPDAVATQLGRSRQMFVDGYYTYENFIDAATRSLQAVEAALRVRLEAESKISFAQLIDRAKKKGLIDDHVHDILHTGRILRNQQIHATMTAFFNPAIAGAAHGSLVSESQADAAWRWECRSLGGGSDATLAVCQ